MPSPEPATRTGRFTSDGPSRRAADTLDELHARKDQLNDAFIYRQAIDQATYAQQRR